MSVSTPPSASQNGDGKPLLSKMYQGGPPLGGMTCNGCGPKFARGPPSDPIYVGREESVGSPSERSPDWRPGDAPHLATKISPGVPPYFPLV